MFITETQAKAIRRKRADLQMSKSDLAKKLGVTVPTVSKIENGNYKAPKRIYASVFNWLAENY